MSGVVSLPCFLRSPNRISSETNAKKMTPLGLSGSALSGRTRMRRYVGS